MAAEVPEGILQWPAGGFPLRSVGFKPKLGFLPTAPEAEKYTDNNQQQKASGLLFARDGPLEMQRAV